MALKKLFSPKKLKHPIDLNLLGVDMHSHLIPGIDDGAQNMDEALEMIGELHLAGYKKLIVTPHIQNEFFKNTPEIINSGLAKLREAVAKIGIPIALKAAAEYLVDDGFEDKIKKGNLLAFGDNYLLIELSYFNPHPNIKEIIFNLQVDGYKVILAHPERYSYWFTDFSKFEELKDRNVYFQINLISLARHYPDPVKKTTEMLIDKNMVEFVGTDIHNQHYMNSFQNARLLKYFDILLKSGKLLNYAL